MNLEDRPLPTFRKGDRIRLVDDTAIAGFRKRLGVKVNSEFVVKAFWKKHIRRKQRYKHLVVLDGYPDWIFSARRFELIHSNQFPEDLFTI